MKRADQIYYIVFSLLAILLTAAFQVITSTHRQLSLQIIGMPHFIIPLLLLIFSFSIVTIKKKFWPLLFSVSLAFIYLYAYSLNIQMRVLAVYIAVVYGLAHVIRDQTWIEIPGPARRYALPILLFIAAAFSSLYAFIHAPLLITLFSAISILAALVCAREIFLALKKECGYFSVSKIYYLYVFSALTVWLLLKALWWHNDFWDLFIYHVIFWYFIYFYQLYKSRNILRLFYIFALVVVVNAIYILGAQYGLSKGWLTPIPSLSLNGVYSAEQTTPLYYALFDVRMFYAWIIFHVTMSWSSNIRIFKPAETI